MSVRALLNSANHVLPTISQRYVYKRCLDSLPHIPDTAETRTRRFRVGCQRVRSIHLTPLGRSTTSVLYRLVRRKQAPQCTALIERYTRTRSTRARV